MKKILLLTFIFIRFSYLSAQLLTTVAGGNGIGYAQNQLGYPESIFVDSIGNLYVVEQTNHRVQRFPPGSTSATNGVTVAGSYVGAGANQLDHPFSIAVDAAGYIYVGDDYNHRLQRFPPGSTGGTDAVSIGISSINAATPSGAINALYADPSGNIYVTGTDRIIMFPPGSDSATIGIVVAGGTGPGSAANQLNGPTGIGMDAHGNLYVADAGNDRIQQFPPGSDSTTSAVTVGVGSHITNQNNVGANIFVTPRGDIYVSDGYSAVFLFPAGSNVNTLPSTVVGGNGFGSGFNQLQRPYGVFVGIHGDIYVSDTENFRVLRFGEKISSGVSDISDLSTLPLYPNPNTGTFILRTTDDIGREYIITDLLGRAVAHQMITSDAQTISLHDITPGTYLIEVRGSASKAIRFTVE